MSESVYSFYLSGLDYSESSHMVIYITQFTCSYISIIHYLDLKVIVIAISIAHLILSLLNTWLSLNPFFIGSFISAICVYVVFLSHNH